MGTGSQDKDGLGPAPRAKTRFTVGMLALVLFCVNAAVTTFSSLAVGRGPQGLALASLYIAFTIPLILFVIFLGIMSIIRKQGRVPGTIALIATSAVFLSAIYSMAAEGWA